MGDRPRKALILMVPKGGLEPPCPQGTPDFESGASTSSTTPAMVVKELIKTDLPCQQLEKLYQNNLHPIHRGRKKGRKKGRPKPP